jgi:pimeloyl-ACP methyl ester carboxylesterase
MASAVVAGADGDASKPSETDTRQPLPKEAPPKVELKWKTVNIQYEYKGSVVQNAVTFADDIDEKTPIRGYFWRQLAGQGGWNLDEFAHSNHMAMFDSFHEEDPTCHVKTPVQAMLDAAAEATGHKELKHACCIIQGLSAGGRGAARWASKNPSRTLAVILDHSSTLGKGPCEQLPALLGIPMFFSSSYSDTYQHTDRRALHYRWCKIAYESEQQPCTSAIHHKESGNVHNQAGSRDLQAVWLEEVLPLRLPNKIPMDGSPYPLRDLDIRKGLVVIATLAKEDGRSYHTDVQILPANEETIKKGCWWLPGPRSASMYVDWVKRNGGTVKEDLSAATQPGS